MTHISYLKLKPLMKHWLGDLPEAVFGYKFMVCEAVHQIYATSTRMIRSIVLSKLKDQATTLLLFAA